MKLFSENEYRMMKAALLEAHKALRENEVPVGAVIVKDEKIIGKGYNRTESLNDATAHAEIIAMGAASETIGNWRLNECDLYVTAEPCIMCTGAAVFSRLRSIYFAVDEPKFGACGSVYNIPAENKFNHKIAVYAGICEEESRDLLRLFFEKRRNSDYEDNTFRRSGGRKRNSG